MGARGREITALKLATLSRLAYSHSHLFLHLKKHVAGQKFHADEEALNEATAQLRAQFCDSGIQRTGTQAKEMPSQQQ